MSELMIQKIWKHSFSDYVKAGNRISEVQNKTSWAIIRCKSGMLGVNASVCTECGHLEIHNNSCRNRNCPNCQAVLKEIWVDKRRSEVIDSPYFHVVFTLPHELNPLLYHNQKLLYGLFHKCCSETLLELSASPKYLGAVPGIIQVLHTWNQEIDYHVHMHCIVSGGGLTSQRKLRVSKNSFFIPVHVLRDKFKGKFLSFLDQMYQDSRLSIPESCQKLRNRYEWADFRDRLYKIAWCPYVKETFNGFGNAIEYLGRYTHRIAISNSRILSVTDKETTFSARGVRPGDPKRTITLSNEEFIRRYLLHVLPKAFQRIRYYGFLNNRMRSKNLKLIFDLQGHQRFQRKLDGMSAKEILLAVWRIDISVCPCCGQRTMKPSGRTDESSYPRARPKS